MIELRWIVFIGFAVVFLLVVFAYARLFQALAPMHAERRTGSAADHRHDEAAPLRRATDL